MALHCSFTEVSSNIKIFANSPLPKIKDLKIYNDFKQTFPMINVFGLYISFNDSFTFSKGIEYIRLI